MGLILFLLTTSAVMSSAVAQGNVEGGTFVPTSTSDDRLVKITITYVFRLDMSKLNEPTTRAQRTIVELMEANTNGIIATRLQVYLLERVAQLSYVELIAMIGDAPDDNALVDELTAFLSARHELAGVDLVTMSVTVE